MRTKPVMINTFILTLLLVSSFVITAEAESLDVTVTVNSPEIVEIGNNFNVTITISYVEDFDAANFDVTYNPEIINVTEVTGGEINNTNLPCAWNFINDGRIRLIINLPGLSGVTGEGHLAEIQFETITTGTSNINLSNGVISNKTVQPITAQWNNDTVQIEGTVYTISINVNGQGSVAKNPDKQYYLQGETVELSANPTSGWSFDHWDGNIAGSTNPYTITMDEDKTINAVFTEDNPGGPGNPPAPPQPPVNDNVIANASESEAFGYIGVPVTFDSSKSTGDITSYEWDFGDGQTGSGEIVTHTYTIEDIYTVTLTVSGATRSDTETFEVVITSVPNTPPTKPVLTGSNSGNINVEYTYTAVSSDDDNDTLRYVFDWGDGEITTTEFLSEGQQVTQKHIWTSPGRYVVKVTVSDNKTDSNTLEYTVLIDAIIVGDIGYLTDDNADGTYDVFHGNGLETNVEKQTDEAYLIDTNADDTYDKLFDTVTLRISECAQVKDKKEKTTPFPIEYVVIGLIVAIFFGLILYLLKNKPDKDLEKNKPNSDNKERLNEIISNHEKKKEERSAQNKINVRCPRCKEMLSVTKSDVTEGIKCSNCGKTGNIEYN